MKLTSLLSMVFLTALMGCAPEPGLRERRYSNALQDRQTHREQVEPMSAPLTLAEAIAYAHRNNLDLWVQQQQQRYDQEQAAQATLKMLPSVILNGEINERDKIYATSSESITTGEKSLESSFSSEKRARKLDWTMTWNLVDFGIGYFRSRQARNRILQTGERIRREKQNLTLRITRAYWRLAAARRASRLAGEVQASIQTLQEALAAAVKNRDLSETDALMKETPLLEQAFRLRRHERELQRARAELAKLLGVAPGQPWDIVQPDFSKLPESDPLPDIAALEDQALENRPELFEHDLDEATSADEARITLARMLPNPAVYYRSDMDWNRFLYHDTWYTLGLRTTLDLLNLPKRDREHTALKEQQELIRKKRMALSIAILTQLHLALIEHEEVSEQMMLSRIIANKRKQLLTGLRKQVEEGKLSAGDLLAYELKYLSAETRHLMITANLQTARARIDNTVGLNWNWPAPEKGKTTPPMVEPAEIQTCKPPASGAVPPRNKVRMPQAVDAIPELPLEHALPNLSPRPQAILDMIP